MSSAVDDAIERAEANRHNDVWTGHDRRILAAEVQRLRAEVASLKAELTYGVDRLYVIGRTEEIP